MPTVDATATAVQMPTAQTATTGLNDEQRAAVEHGAGPLRIMAGAGTGKTKTLTARVISLIERGLARPEDILALTFTNKAAGEMAERVSAALRQRFPGAKRVTVQTYNSFGYQIVREQGHLLGLPAEPLLLSEAERTMFLRTMIDDLPLDTFDLRRLSGRDGLLGQLLQFFDRWREEAAADRDPEGLVELYVDFAHQRDGRKEGKSSGVKPDAGRPEAAVSPAQLELRREQARALIESARIYEQRLVAVGALDFAAQISLAVRILREHPEVRDAYRHRFPWLLVDEYQDTNHLQSMLVEALAGESGNVTIVGDPDQSIYAFRGAARDSIIDFPRDFPMARLLALSQNYRSTAPILDAANALIGADDDRADRPPLIMAPESRAAQVEQVRPLVLACDRADLEAETIAEMIPRLRHESTTAEGTPRYAYRDFAILVRKNGVIADLRAVLTAHGIPVAVDSGTRLFDDSETVGLIAYLRALVAPDADVELARALLLPRFGLREADILSLAEGRRQRYERSGEREPLFAALARRVVGEPDSPLAAFQREFLAHRAEQFRLDADALIRLVITDHAGSLTRRGRDNCERLAELAREWVERKPRLPWPTDGVSPLATFCDYLGVLADNGESPEQAALPAGEDAVAIITAHAAKGLEWPVVFIARCNDRDWSAGHTHSHSLFPPSWGHRGNRSPEQLAADEQGEERRLFYVAMTRARERLYLTWAARDENHKKEVDAYHLLADCAASCETAEPPAASGDPESALAREMASHMAAFAQQYLAQPGPIDQVALQRAWDEFWAEARQDRPELTPPACAAEWLGRWSPSAGDDSLGWVPQVAPDAPPDLPEMLSYTHLETYEECPARFNLAYVLRAPSRPSYGGIEGTAVHRAVAIAAERLATGAPLGRTAVRSLIQREVATAWSGQQALSGVAPSAAVTAAPHGADRAAGGESAAIERMVDAFFGIGEQARPLGVELEFYVPIGGAVIHGFIDRLDQLPGGDCAIVDYKTHARAWTEEEARHKLQIPLYILGSRAIGHPASRGTLVFLRHGTRITISPTEADLRTVEARVAAIVGRIKRREFPAQPGAHCRFCEHRDFCEQAE